MTNRNNLLSFNRKPVNSKPAALKSISSLVAGFIGEGPTEQYREMQATLKAKAEEFGGTFDIDGSFAEFEGEDGTLSIHGYIYPGEEEGDPDYIMYQALLLRHDPECMTVSGVHANFDQTIRDLKM